MTNHLPMQFPAYSSYAVGDPRDDGHFALEPLVLCGTRDKLEVQSS